MGKSLQCPYRISRGDPLLGAVVGVALENNTIIAVSIGGTVTDMCGFFLVLGLATVALPWLT